MKLEPTGFFRPQRLGRRHSHLSRVDMDHRLADGRGEWSDNYRSSCMS
jgi:hypothetical protein